MTTYVKTPASEIFSRFKGPFWRQYVTLYVTVYVTLYVTLYVTH